MPSRHLLESFIQDPVYEGDNHHEDPAILFLLTSSRIDSIRTSQYLAFFNSFVAIFPQGPKAGIMRCEAIRELQYLYL